VCDILSVSNSWCIAVYHMGTKQAFIVFGGGIMAASVLTSVLFRAGGSTPRTHNKEWAAATKELLKFQDMVSQSSGHQVLFLYCSESYWHWRTPIFRSKVLR